MFIVYDPVSGEIQQTISGPDKHYGDMLTEQGLTWLFDAEVMSLDPRGSYVDPASRAIVEKQAMPIIVDKMSFRADGVDGATLTGIPVGARVVVMHGDEIQFSGVASEPEMQLTSVVTTVYRVSVSADRFLPWHGEVTAE